MPLKRNVSHSHHQKVEQVIFKPFLRENSLVCQTRNGHPGKAGPPVSAMKKMFREPIKTYPFSTHNILERLSANIILDSPGREDVSLLEDCLHLFDRSALGLREHEDDVDTGNEVE